MKKKLEALFEYQGQDRVISCLEMQNIINSTLQRPAIRLNSGIRTLDDSIGGFIPGELTVISGPTGNGKSLLAQTFTYHFDRQEFQSLWFSFEMPPAQFLPKFGPQPPLFYMPQEMREKDLPWLKDRILEGIVKYDVKAVFIDHLHFLLDLKSRHNMSLEIGAIMRWLKTLAREAGICIFIIAHVNKPVYEGKEYTNDSLRDSTFVAQESDNVLFVWRTEKIERGSFLKITKDRKNGTLGKKMGLLKNGLYLEEAGL